MLDDLIPTMPEERLAPLMVRFAESVAVQRQRRLAVVVELAPVHGNHDLLARADHVRDPLGEAVLDVDALVAEQAVDLLDGVLCNEAARLRQRLADNGDREGGTGHDVQRGACERVDTLGVQLARVERADEAANVV
jgi:hypothetical protein